MLGIVQLGTHAGFLTVLRARDGTGTRRLLTFLAFADMGPQLHGLAMVIQVRAVWASFPAACGLDSIRIFDARIRCADLWRKGRVNLFSGMFRTPGAGSRFEPRAQDRQ